MEIKINNETVNVMKGQTILQVAKKMGINIPTLCYLEDLFPSGACRMCVVELEGNSNLVTACSVEVTEGMSVLTHSDKVIKARKTILDLLLSSHPDDCLYCEKNGFCELQQLCEELDVKTRRFAKDAPAAMIDKSSPSIAKDSSKCILCGRCVRVCEEVQSISAIDFVGRGSSSKVAPSFIEGLNTSSCVNCGQCTVVCPTGALIENNNIKEVLTALDDPEKTVMVQHAPAVSVTIGEYFDFKTGADINGVMTSALKRIGFDRVFETSFSADLTIMEEASELVDRIKNNGPLPMFTSCSPAWVKFVEQNYPEFTENVSTCKSPQQMMGAMIKSYYAETQKIDPKKIVTVSLMPCTAKKFEAKRDEMTSENGADVDIVLTTRELAKLIKMFHINLHSLSPERPDDPLGSRSSAGKLFGVTGGVAEAAIRTAGYLLTGENGSVEPINELRELNGIKELTLNVAGVNLNVAVISGLANAKEILDDIKAGKASYHFVEVMSCPGGCIAGGGQPGGLDKSKVAARMKTLYQIDSKDKIRRSHENLSIKKLYDTYLGEPLGEKSHKYLHTTYRKRNTLV